tara:strand:+ start:231 stop:401 length:171 start_codon:yes stop_codon:yes gene_type:complete
MDYKEEQLKRALVRTTVLMEEYMTTMQLERPLVKLQLTVNKCLTDEKKMKEVDAQQ